MPLRIRHDDAYGQSEPCAEYESEGTWAPQISPAELGTGSTPIPVARRLGGLHGGTTYHFRLTAKIGGETETGADETFKTLGPPVISEDARRRRHRHRGDAEGPGQPRRPRRPTAASNTAQPPPTARAPPRPRSAQTAAEHPVTAASGASKPAPTYHWRASAPTPPSKTAASPKARTANCTPTAPSPSSPAPTTPSAPAPRPSCPTAGPMRWSARSTRTAATSSAASAARHPGGYVQAAADGGKIAYTAQPLLRRTRRTSSAATNTSPRAGSRGWSNHGIHPPVAGRQGIPIPASSGSSPKSSPSRPTCAAPGLIDYQTRPYDRRRARRASATSTGATTAGRARASWKR